MHEIVGRIRPVWIGLVIVLLAVSAEAADVDVMVNRQALAEVELVVVLPLGCGSDPDCRQLEDDIAQAVRDELGLEVVPREDVEKAIRLMGLNNPQGRLAHLVAREVDADAYLKMQSRETPRNPQGGGSPPPGGVALGDLSWSPFWPQGISLRKKLLTKIKSAGLEVLTTDGTTVIEGRSKGRRGVLAHVVGILKRAADQAQDGSFDPGRRK